MADGIPVCSRTEALFILSRECVQSETCQWFDGAKSLVPAVTPHTPYPPHQVFDSEGKGLDICASIPRNLLQLGLMLSLSEHVPMVESVLGLDA